MISFVYFDAGGVAFIDFTGNNKVQEFKDGIGITKEKDHLFEKIWKEHEAEICLSFDVDRLVPILEKELDMQLPPDYSMLDDFVNRFDANMSIWPVIKNVRKFVNVGLLTNMYPRMLKGIQEQNILPSITWDVIIDSSVVGYQKPDPKIFEIAEKRAGVPKNEILFIDNTPLHIAAAKKFGWQTFLYDSSDPESSSKALAKFISFSPSQMF